MRFARWVALRRSNRFDPELDGFNQPALNRANENMQHTDGTSHKRELQRNSIPL
jgi:hypothetical protein